MKATLPPTSGTTSSSSASKLAVKLPLIFFVLYAFVFILGGLSGGAPFLATVKWVFVIDQPTIRAGFFVGDTSDGAWTFHWNWCKNHNIDNSGDTCEELRVNWLVSSLLWGVHLPMVLVIMVALFKHPAVAFWLAPIAFMFQLAGGACFVLRVAPMFRELLQYKGPLTSAAWSLGWAGGIAIAAVGCNFIVVLLLAYFHRRLLGLDRELETMFLGAHFYEPPLPPRTAPIVRGSGSEEPKKSAKVIAPAGDAQSDEDDPTLDATTNDEPALQFQPPSKRTTHSGSERRRREKEPYDSEDPAGRRGYTSGGSGRRRHFQPDEDEDVTTFGSDSRRRGYGGGGSSGYRSGGFHSSSATNSYTDGGNSRRRGWGGGGGDGRSSFTNTNTNTNTNYFTDEDLQQSGGLARRRF